MKRTVHCVVEPPATARGSDPGFHWRLRSQTEVIPTDNFWIRPWQNTNSKTRRDKKETIIYGKNSSCCGEVDCCRCGRRHYICDKQRGVSTTRMCQPVSISMRVRCYLSVIVYS